MTHDTENRTFSDKFMLRLPDGMRERIKVAAEANNRSMNAEIVSRLEASFLGVKNIKAVKTDTGRIDEPTAVELVDFIYRKAKADILRSMGLDVPASLEPED